MVTYPKTPLSEVGRLRKFKFQEGILSADLVAVLDSASLEAFFSVTFLKALMGKAYTEGEYYKSGELAKNALKLVGITTVGEMKKLSVEKLCCLRGMGPHALTLTLDTVETLGQRFTDERELPEQSREVCEKEGAELVEKLFAEDQ